jgi:hypothetical protein
MTASEFERYHGVALARLLRGQAGREVRVTEMKPDEGWSVLIPARGPVVVIRHRSRPRRLRSTPGGLSWRFSFSGEQLARLRRHTRQGRLRLLLICGREEKNQQQAEMALLEPREVARLLDLSSFLEQRLTVQAHPRKELWVLRNKIKVKVPRSRFAAAR